MILSAPDRSLDAWFAERDWTPQAFQRRAWAAYRAGESGLIHAPTGSGKTVAALGGAALDWIETPADQRLPVLAKRPRAKRPTGVPPLILWLTPLRALAADTAGAIAAFAEGVGLPWTVDLRTGDTSSSDRRRQQDQPATVLVTTPESLTILLSHPGWRDRLATVRLAVCDEWHELMSTKRGVQTELALARLRGALPALRTWGLSATIGNLDEAMGALLGRAGGTLVHADLPRPVELTTLLPAGDERFPWAGHLGLKLLPAVLLAIERGGSTLLFTNVRSQAEAWFDAIRVAKPEWADTIALHHGSLDRALRDAAEAGLRQGRLRLVVATSSLDLGVDFPAVDQVIQVGSPKGIARFLQRAGRSGHRPGAPARILGVPANAFELIEFSAARRGVAERAVEPRRPLDAPLDVLAQHLLTCAAGGGFVADDLLAEVRGTGAYRSLSDADFRWALTFAASGGQALKAYPRFARLIEVDGRWQIATPDIARRHRLAIGTIASDQSLAVRLGRKQLGSIEESFIARLRPGAVFVFAGRRLMLRRVRDGVAEVKAGGSGPALVPQWLGGRLPLSSYLAERVLALLAEAGAGRFDSLEMQAVRPILELQQRWSRLPTPDELLIEATTTREGHQVTLFLFAGRLAHEGLASLIAWRLGQRAPRTVTTVISDYAIGLLSPQPFAIDAAIWREVLSPDGLEDDLLACLDAHELGRRRFREIARVAGLLVPDPPGKRRRAAAEQASAGLFYDVFAAHDPGNLLIAQARAEVLAGQLDTARLRAALERARGQRLALVEATRLTPLSFPLWAEFVHAEVSSERWEERVKRMAISLERKAEEGE